MKIPARPPALKELLEESSSESLERIVLSASDLLLYEKYLHWDELRHRTPPAGLSIIEWWIALKMSRRGTEAKSIPLLDTKGRDFSFNLPDPLPERLYAIDLSAGEPLRMPEQVANPETRKSYVIRSLIEEAITSSQLEGAATTREVAKEMIRQGRPPRDRGERMILNNYRAMERIIEIKNEPLTLELIFQLHRMVTEETLDNPSAAGRFRLFSEECVVGDDFGEIYHVPPPADQLEERAATMIEFANGKTPGHFVHPAIRSMILHFWLAYDHPFVDGNGRTARALFYWSMLRNQYWMFEYISISRIILKAPARYGRAFLFTETDENDLTYFLLYHADVVDRAIRELHEDLERRTSEVQALESELRGMVALNHRQRELIKHAIRHPNDRYSVEFHRQSHGVVYQTARTDLLQLADRGLLDSRKVGKSWVFTPAANLEAKLRVAD